MVGELAAQLQAAGAAGDGSRHIYVRLRDIDAVSLTTRTQRTLSLRSPTGAAGAGGPESNGRRALPGARSALTALLDEDSSRCLHVLLSITTVCYLGCHAVLFVTPARLLTLWASWLVCASAASSRRHIDVIEQASTEKMSNTHSQRCSCARVQSSACFAGA